MHCVGNATTRTNGNRRRTGCPIVSAPAIFPIPQRHCVAVRSSCCCSACCSWERERRGGRMVKCLHYHSECILGLGITNYEKDTEKLLYDDILTVFPAPTIPWRRARPCRWSGYYPAVDSATTVHPWRPCDPPLWWHCAIYPCRGSQRERQTQQAGSQAAGRQGRGEGNKTRVNKCVQLEGFYNYNCRLNVNRYRYDTTLITYNRKRLAELVTKFSGIALSRLLFRRLIYSGSTSSRSVKVFEVWYFWCFISNCVQIVVQRAYFRYAKRNATKGTESSR